MFVDILHDYLYKISGRGSIIQKIYSFYETLQIILKGITNITEKDEFIRYIILFNKYLSEINQNKNLIIYFIKKIFFILNIY